eukprot:CAMPEP_0197174816 /NCGR_PEP_ID=MMETSP1423-20130617/1199_1 /TAXON_ID=476441 /ORGANISM="Pseudo-nitzschia heimii, Strain UNC1101" /LENGTH=365 /DNA_ID=CAMNT_0042623805 /DNA_START=27 /DNA_END=1124 /DNA_ORIENTATION=-
MTVIEKGFSFFIVALLIACGVEAQSEINFETCLSGSAATATASAGNVLTTYELLCSDTLSPNSPHTFVHLCSLLSTGVITKSDGTEVNFETILSATTDEEKGHTLFAPTDAAFEAIGLDVVEALLDADSTVDAQIRNDLIARWMELHVLSANYLLEDFTCNGNLLAYNPSDTAAQQQVQKTRCAGPAGTFEQIGGGNVGELDQPTVGSPAGVFNQEFFPNTNNPVTMVLTPDADDSSKFGASSNLITCNGVVQIVDIPLRPGSTIRDGKGTKGYYGAKGYGYYGAKGYGYYGGYYGKSKGYKGLYNPGITATSFFGGRALGEEGVEEGSMEEPASGTERQADRANRRARLESLLVDANGQVEPMD